jgi:type II secretory pathway pseudopilin PulG
MKNSFKAFTLVEMLIVMGIIIILMAVGIASGRFAIRRANKIEHQNAAENIYQALQSYYTDNKEYPSLLQEDGITINNPEALLQTGGLLDEYIDDFDGGSEASYAYAVDNTGQKAIVCVTYGGIADQNYLGLYCTGNAVGDEIRIGGAILPAPRIKDITWDDGIDYSRASSIFEDNKCSNWQNGEWTENCSDLFSTPTPEED